MPSLCSHTAWGNILCKNPPIRSSRSSKCFSQTPCHVQAGTASVLWSFFPTEFVQLRAFSWNSDTLLWTCPQNYLFSRKMNVHNGLFYTYYWKAFPKQGGFSLVEVTLERNSLYQFIITSSNICMLLFLTLIALQTATRLRTFAKYEMVRFHRDLAEAERIWLPNSGAKWDSKIPKIQRGSVLDFGFSPITTSLWSLAPFGKGSISGLLWQPKGAMVRSLTPCPWISLATLHPVLGRRGKDEKRGE